MMADSIQFNIYGVDALKAKLNAVSYDVRRRGGRAALRRAAELVAAKAREGALRLDDAETGRSIADNIALRWNGKRFKQNGDLAFRVGVLKGAVLAQKGETVDKNSGAATPHWRLLEFGTENMAAKPFMRSALADSIGEATMAFVNAYNKSLNRAIKKAAKGQ